MPRRLRLSRRAQITIGSALVAAGVATAIALSIPTSSPTTAIPARSSEQAGLTVPSNLYPQAYQASSDSMGGQRGTERCLHRRPSQIDHFDTQTSMQAVVIA